LKSRLLRHPLLAETKVVNEIENEITC